MRDYSTLKKLNDGEVVDLDGIRLKKAEGELKPGDLYVGERNTGPQLLTAREIYPEGQGGFVVPVDNAYAYDIWECVKVCEA